jgi:small-conductance mechanosensitive channel
MNIQTFTAGNLRAHPARDNQDDLVFSISLVVMLISLKVLTIIARKVSGRYFSNQTSSLIVRGIRYAGIIVIVMTFFHQIGIDISAILGAAGIAGVAIGFAAQTSISNIISGLFLVSEKAFSVNDVIQIEGFTGTVLSIDLLSVKIRTLDNQYVRIPNEKLINRVHQYHRATPSGG